MFLTIKAFVSVSFLYWINNFVYYSVKDYRVVAKDNFAFVFPSLDYDQQQGYRTECQKHTQTNLSTL